jgi:light-regulated signal transduction histidine kinase (bacteriophytochrome)
MLRVVRVNLLSNAIKFTRRESQAKMDIGSAEGNKDEIVVFIMDYGAGLNRKYLKKPFGLFQRLHQSSAFVWAIINQAPPCSVRN